MLALKGILTKHFPSKIGPAPEKSCPGSVWSWDAQEEGSLGIFQLHPWPFAAASFRVTQSWDSNQLFKTDEITDFCGLPSSTGHSFPLFYHSHW